MKACIKRKTNNLKKFVDKIKKLQESNVESGYFAEQGMHPTAGISFVELASIHASGFTTKYGDVPARDVRPATLFDMKGMFKGSLNSYFYKGYSLNDTLDTAGFKITDLAQSYFGIPSPTMPDNSSWWVEIKETNSPLVHYGYLQEAWSFKTSENSAIRRV